MRYLVIAALAGGCSNMATMPAQEEAASQAVIQYSVNAPYQISGASPAGSDGFVYSVLPCAPLACDPWKFTFCYQSTCFTLSHALDLIPVGEVAPIIPANATIAVSGDISCSQWKGSGTIQWQSATPLHWHVIINAVCIDNSFALSGDWQRI